MTIDEACRAVILSRGDAIVIATMGAMGALDRLDVGQPRLSCVPLMGGAAALALGIALAHPNEKVIVLDGDASLLMELGVLVTVAGSRPRNFHHFVIENGVQFAGMSNLPMASSAHDLCTMAAGAGYASCSMYDCVEALTADLPARLSESGPTFTNLRVIPLPPVFKQGVPQRELPDWHFKRMGDEARALTTWLRSRLPATADDEIRDSTESPLPSESDFLALRK